MIRSIMEDKPDAFLSYSRFDDRNGKITAFRSYLSDAVEEVSAYSFNIFQDTKEVGIGQNVQIVLTDMLCQSRFFIPILTPKFFNSDHCRDELRRFLELEYKTGRQDLILPIYWITCPVLEDHLLKAKDDLAKAIDERQRSDWRELRYREFSETAVAQQLEALATQIEQTRSSDLRAVEMPDTVTANGEPKRSVQTLTAPAVLHSHTCSHRQREIFEAFKDIDAPWCPEMVVLPAGTFLMGSEEVGEDQFDAELPQHKVTISRKFALARHPVTFNEYDYFCEETGRRLADDRGWGRGDHPVINVSYDDALSYSRWISEKTGRSYQLPSEAHWEYACRAGTRSAYAFGDKITKRQANFGDYYGDLYGQTSLVGRFPENAWGLQDMHGNVWEWCADWYGDYPSKAVTDPKGPANGRARVVRGGAWNELEPQVRSAYRGRSEPSRRSLYLGFRCARCEEES